MDVEQLAYIGGRPAGLRCKEGHVRVRVRTCLFLSLNKVGRQAGRKGPCVGLTAVEKKYMFPSSVGQTDREKICRGEREFFLRKDVRTYSSQL